MGSGPDTQNSTCVQCTAGYYNDMPNNGRCQICPSGSSAPTPSICLNCLPGTYNPNEGMTTCTNCTGGTYSPVVGATSPDTCRMYVYGVIG
jgi:hypothetical protein